MRFMSPVLVTIAVFAALFQGGPEQAIACTCVGYTDNARFARSLIDHSSALVIVRVIHSEGSGDIVRGQLAVESLLSGSAPKPLNFEFNRNDQCEPYDIDRSSVHFLSLSPPRDGQYQLTGCSGFAMSSRFAAQGPEEQQFLNTLVRILNDDANDTRLLLVAAYIVASVSALVALVGIGTGRRAW